MSWPRVLIGDVAKVRGGKRLPKGHQILDEPTDHPYLRIVDFDVGGFNPQRVKYISNQTFDQISRYTISSKDIYVSIAGTIGRVGMIPASFDGANLTENAAKITNISSLVVAEYLLMYLRSYEGIAQLVGRAGGTSQPKLALYRIEEIDFPLPPVETQQRMAGILSAYDDLIENNRRRIALLEEAARQLYREWFVRFRFPGHEHIQIINGVPEGWERTSASDVLNVLSGGTPNTATPRYWDGGIGFFTPKDAVIGAYVSMTEKTITEEGLAACNSKLYPKDTLFITARGTVGKMNLAQVPMAMNQSCYALVSKTFLSQRFLYLAMDSSLQQLQSQASGAVFAAIIVSTFDRILVTKPDERIAAAFDDFVNPIFDQIAVLGRQTEQLVKARDLLLPRLMSGSLAA